MDESIKKTIDLLKEYVKQHRVMSLTIPPNDGLIREAWLAAGPIIEKANKCQRLLDVAGDRQLPDWVRSAAAAELVTLAESDDE